MDIIDRNKKPVRWWEEPEVSLRKDIHDALVELRAHVENLGSKPSLIVNCFGVKTQRELTAVHTTRVKEWEFGYCVTPLNESQGFYVRTLYVKLHGGKLDEINKDERRQIIDAITSGVLDEGSETHFEGISDTTFAIRQPFAVMFWNERNPNIVTPSKALLRNAFKLPLVGTNGKGKA